MTMYKWGRFTWTEDRYQRTTVEQGIFYIFQSTASNRFGIDDESIGKLTTGNVDVKNGVKDYLGTKIYMNLGILTHKVAELMMDLI
jgi:hypothetical protein